MSLVITQDHGAIRHLILNRSEKRNAFSMEFVDEVGAALKAAADDVEVRCVVIRGDGPVFSAGMDIKELASLSGSPGNLRKFRRHCITAWNLAEEMTKPVIAQIHGVCIGGAFELACACDMRVVAHGSRLSIPEVRLGMVPDVGGSSRLSSIVGIGRAKELILTGGEIGAEEAYRIGFANKIAPLEELDAATAAITDQIITGFPVPIGLAKRLIDASAKPALSTTLEMEITAQEVAVAAMQAALREATATETVSSPS